MVPMATTTIKVLETAHKDYGALVPGDIVYMMNGNHQTIESIQDMGPTRWTTAGGTEREFGRTLLVTYYDDEGTHVEEMRAINTRPGGTFTSVVIGWHMEEVEVG